MALVWDSPGWHTLSRDRSWRLRWTPPAESEDPQDVHWTHRNRAASIQALRAGSVQDPVDAKDLLLLRLSLQLAPGGSTSEPKALAKIS